MKRNYSERWTEEDTFRFIKARIRLEENFRKKVVDIRSCWESVGLEAELPDMSWQRLRKRWGNLLNKYKQIKEPPTGAGTDDVEMATTWPFFDLNEYCADRHIINPPILIDSESAYVTLSVPSPQDVDASTNSASTSGSGSGGIRKREHPSLTGLERDEIKTNKEIRRASSLLVTFMSQRMGIACETSDSE